MRRHRHQLKTRRPTTDASSGAQHLTKTDGRSAGLQALIGVTKMNDRPLNAGHF